MFIKQTHQKKNIYEITKKPKKSRYILSLKHYLSSFTNDSLFIWKTQLISSLTAKVVISYTNQYIDLL